MNVYLQQKNILTDDCYAIIVEPHQRMFYDSNIIKYLT